MKKLLAGVLAACLITASGWAAAKEVARQDKSQNKCTLVVYDSGSGLIVGNQRANASFETIVDGGTNTFTVMSVALDAIQVAIEADGILAQNIQGATPDGESLTANAVTGGGVDLDGVVRTLSVGKDGATFINTNEIILDDCDAATGFSAISDAASIATSTTHIAGTNALTWDKDGGSNVISAVQKTITTAEIVLANGVQVGYLFNIPDATALTDIEYTFIRIGEDSSNYLEFRQGDENLVVGWNSIIHAFVRPTSQTGDGTSTGNAKYIAIGCETDDAADTISTLIVDDVVLNHMAKTAVVEAIAEVVDLGVVRNRDGATNDRLNIGLDVTKNASYVQSESLAAESGGNLDTISGDTTAILAEAVTIKTSTDNIETYTQGIETAIEAIGVLSQNTQGAVADGDPNTANPVVGAGVDGGADVQAWLSDTDGHQQVDVLSSALPSGGATSANQALILAEAVTIKTNTGTIAGDTTSIDGKMVDGTDIGDVTVNNATGAAGVFVQGQAADGVAVAGAPVRVAGKDANGDTQDIITATDGVLVLGFATTSADSQNANTEKHIYSANSATGRIGVFNYMVDPSDDRWDRMRGNPTGGLFVQGAVAAGSAFTGFPNVMAGADDGSLIQTLHVDVDGVAAIHTDHAVIDDADATTGWAQVLDATGISTDVIHLQGNLSVEWDKGAVNVESSIGKTIDSPITIGHASDASIEYMLEMPDAGSITFADFVFIRIGEDASNYIEFQTDDSVLNVGWNILRHPVISPTSQTGSGLSTGTIRYVAVGVETGAAANTIADLRVDGLSFEDTMGTNVFSTPATAVDLGAVAIKDGNSGLLADVAIDSSLKALYVQSQSMAAESGGNLDDIATDTGTIDADTSTLAAAVAAGQYQVDVVAELPAGTQEIGSMAISDGGAVTADVGDGAAVDYVYVRLTDGTDSSSLDGSGNLEIVGEAGGDVKVTLDSEKVVIDKGAALDQKAVVVGVGPTQILAGAATTRRVIIQNADNTLIAIGASDVTLNSAAATDGLVLSVCTAANDGTGGSVPLETEAAIYGKGTDAGSKVIIIFESD